MSGQHSLDQTFYLPVEAMNDPSRSSLRILERLTGKALFGAYPAMMDGQVQIILADVNEGTHGEPIRTTSTVARCPILPRPGGRKRLRDGRLRDG